MTGANGHRTGGLVEYSLRPFGPGQAAPSGDLAWLHATLLPASPVSLLGPRFMERFYYRILPREGLVVGAVAYVENQPAGFIAATHDRGGFTRISWWPQVAWVLGTSILRAPGSLGPAWEAWKVLRTRRRVEDGDPDGEILSLGVLPAYRQSGFVRQVGLRIASDLLAEAVRRLGGMGVRRIGAAVNADNSEARLFYAGLGWTLHRPRIPGWSAPTLEFVSPEIG